VVLSALQVQKESKHCMGNAQDGPH
jgi:hypothetical protein